jgi:hypothetical protein
VAALTGLAFTLVTTQIVGDIFLPNVARAAPPQPNKRVALYVVGKNKAAAGDAKVIEAFLRTELSSLVNVSAVVSGTEPPATLRELVLPSVEAGFRALNERNGEAAEKAFSKAYRDLVQYRGDFDKRIFARILKGYGSAQVLDGNVGAGQETIDTGLNLWPNQMIQEYGWTLDLRTAFNELSNRKSQLKPGSIEVDTDPPGAAVRVNGVLRGFAPVTIQDLAAGRHWIETTIDGYGRESMFVEVPSGDSAIHSLELLPTPAKSQFDTAMAALVRGLPKGQVGPSLSDLQRVMKADAVIALELSSTNTNYVLAGFIRDGQGEPQRVTRTVAKDGDLPSNLRSFLATILKREVGADDSDLALDGPPQTSVMGEGDIVLDPRDPIFRTRDTKTDDSVTSEWWFWTLIGGVTAGLVVGGIALFSGEDQGSGPAGNLVINVNRLP